MHQALGAYVFSTQWSTIILLILSLCLLCHRSNVWICIKKTIDKKWGGDTKRATVLSADTQQGSNGAPTDPGPGPAATPAQSTLEPVVRLKRSAYRWDRRFLLSRNPNSLFVVDRKVKGLLNKLTMKKFDSISDKIVAWANKSEKEKDGRTLIHVIRLIFENAIDQAMWSEMYARLCRKMVGQISAKVQVDGVKNAEGEPIAGGQLFRIYLLNRCQNGFERGWVAKEPAAAAASNTIEDQAAKAIGERTSVEEEIALHSEKYYAAQKARRRGLGLIKFIGELFKLKMLTERTMHECIKKLLGNIENPEEEEIESLCMLLTTVGQLLDTTKARAHMDVYFSRMKELTKSLNVSSRMQFMLQDILELRERKWISRNAVDAPTTIAQIHEVAGREKAAQEKESYQRQTSMSRDGSRRGGERGEFPQVGADGCAVSGAPWPPSKAGDLPKFGQISDMTVPATLRQISGKSSVSNAKPGSSSNTPHTPCKQEIAKSFQNPSSAPPSQPDSDSSSPNIRPSDLPPLSQPPLIPLSSHPPHPSFVPQNGMRPRQPNVGPNGDAATGSGPTSPQYQRQVPNGNTPHIPSGPGGPGAPQMSAGLGSPRMTPQHHPPPPGRHIPAADKKHKATERELLKTEEEEREKECLQREVEERKKTEEDTRRLQQEEEEKERREEEVARVKAEAKAAPLPSALATARIIDDLGRIPYPEGIKSPRVELNINAKDGKFRYDREFLLQFMSICKEKPDSLPALDAIGLEPSDQINYPMSRGGPGRHCQGSGTVPSQRVRVAEEEAVKAKPEEGEVIMETSSADADTTVTSKDKAKEEDLRINTTSPPSELPRCRLGPLDLSTTEANIPAPLPSALATARIIDDLGRVPYPEGIKSPRVELNINAKDGKFIYDRGFLLQFMPVCKEKPESLPDLDAIGLEPSGQINYPMSRGGPGRHRQGSGAVPSQRQIFTTGEPEFGQTGNEGAPITFGPQSSIYAGKKDTEPKPIKVRNKNAKKKIERNIKKFSAVRNLDEAEVYFTQLPAKHHPLLVDKFISFAVKSEADAQLVAQLFSRASTKNLCTIADFESGFAGVIELLGGIVIDAPMAFKLMATVMKGPAFDDGQRTRLASKTDSAKLLGLLS
ncbi:hypothetical protein ARMSODRAFT_1081035 [Armillaria solidipes]|uniref:MI domain-containing protein n=1 Tax=Armillaria solidipes TaxID=1076256 RepID=A0A2H3C6V3_9AGAR|nr:hypothetical protein ARMSODRAFT_1081035 [Armillaria solidipes]